MSSYVIQQILKAKKITDYLSSKGYEPKGREVNGKLRYCCPLHQERTPSFTVYLNGEYENFFCYGCRARYHIIHLYRDMEGVSTGEAIRALSGDLELNLNAEIAHAINEIESDRSLNAEYTPPQLALIIGRQLYDFTKRVEKDPQCMASVDQVESIVDRALLDCDIETLKILYDSLPDTLYKSIQMFDERKEKQLIEVARAVSN